jgi:hypothetical protein
MHITLMQNPEGYTDLLYYRMKKGKIAGVK